LKQRLITHQAATNSWTNNYYVNIVENKKKKLIFIFIIINY
jgi:hypothetical protein